MTSVLLVGCGKMGSAMLSRWLSAEVVKDWDFLVISPQNAKPNQEKCKFYQSIEQITEGFLPDIVVFAVKPQSLAEVLPLYAQRFGKNPLYISIAAGKNLAFYGDYFGAGARIIRAMPNTPALVGKAITTLCANDNCSASDKNSATKLMETFGKALWIEEGQMDAATAISGSGPAYLFLFLEALGKAGVAAGLPPKTATELALATVHGSIHLAEKTTEDLQQLRNNVTSKGGTTQAALQVLLAEQTGLIPLMEQAVLAAVARAKSL